MDGRKIKNILLLIFSLVLVYGVQWAASSFTRSSQSSWYRGLNKASWTPPGIVFGIVWTILYGLIAISFWLILKNSKAYTPMVFIAFFVQLALNFTWSFSFFYLQSPLLGLINIVLLWLAICWNIYAFYIHSKWAAILLLPYLLWVSYAISLNFYIWLKN